MDPTRIYCQVAGYRCLTCQSERKLDVFLRIRRDANLIIPKIEWKVSTEAKSILIIERRVLESLGCDNRKMVMAARTKYDADINVRNGNEEDVAGITATLFGLSVFHNAEVMEDDGLDGNDLYLDFGDDAPDQIDEELGDRISRSTHEDSVRQHQSICEGQSQKVPSTPTKTSWQIHQAAGEIEIHKARSRGLMAGSSTYYVKRLKVIASDHERSSSSQRCDEDRKRAGTNNRGRIQRLQREYALHLYGFWRKILAMFTPPRGIRCILNHCSAKILCTNPCTAWPKNQSAHFHQQSLR